MVHNKVCLLYSGRKGGGLNDLMKMCCDIKSVYQNVLYVYALPRNIGALAEALEHFGIQGVNLQPVINFYKMLTLKAIGDEVVTVFLPMPSMKDLPIFLISLLTSRIRIYCVIHNPIGFTTHKSKLYRLVDKILDICKLKISAGLIFLSRNVQREYEPMLKNQKHILLEYTRYYPVLASYSNINERTINFLIFGRNLSYKNARETYDILRKIESTGRVFKAIFAGDGYDFESTNSIKIENRWISDEEAYELHQKTRVAVLYYSEVSQSGPALYALELGCRLITSNLDYFMSLSKNRDVVTCSNADSLEANMLQELDSSFNLKKIGADKVSSPDVTALKVLIG